MKTILYYFTGTGNSLAVARAIADRLPDTELIPIPMLICSGFSPDRRERVLSVLRIGDNY